MNGGVIMSECIFCKIASGQMGTPFLYEDDLCVAFGDIAPQAAAHALVVPKAHCANLNEAAGSQLDLGALMRACAQVARVLGVDSTGYRVVTNCGRDARQSVEHLHFHVLGGQTLGEKMS